MADPCSTIGLLGTALSLTKGVMDFASSVKDAPEEVEKLSRELTSLRDVFEQLLDLVENEESREDFTEVSTLYNAAGVRSLSESLVDFFRPSCLT